jgi:hypothetical protein
MMCRVEEWSLHGVWKEIDRIYKRSYRKILWLPRFTANGGAESNLGKDSRRAEMLSVIVEYCLCLLNVHCREIVRNFLNDG